MTIINAVLTTIPIYIFSFFKVPSKIIDKLEAIKDIRTFNSALMGKWRWDVFYKQEEPWAKIINSKYGGWRALEEGTRGNHESTWWKDLVSIQQQQQNIVIKRETVWKVGGGDKFRFWKDP